MMLSLRSSSFLMFFLFTVIAFSKTDSVDRMTDLVQAQQWEEVLSLVRNKKDDFKLKEETSFFEGVALFRTRKFEEAFNTFLSISKEGPFYPYVKIFLARISLELKKEDEAIKYYEQVLNEKFRTRLVQEASLELGKLYLQKGNLKSAEKNLVFAEKKMRGQENYQSALWSLALVEKRSGKNEAKCRSLLKIYTRYPDYEEAHNWGFNLTESQFDGERSGCSWDADDFRNRMRSLIWAAEDVRAQKELQQIKKEKKLTPVEVDKLEAIYFAQVGEPLKAYEVLQDDFANNKDNFEFLNFAAPIAARAGKISEAIEAYYQAYKNNPKSKLGKQALYQSAFLSYQFRNYEQATQRFEEFLKGAPSDQLARDARWQLAWLQYLQGNYGEAKDRFLKLANIADFSGQKKSKKEKSQAFKKGQPVDRVTYWLAMSLYKLGRYEEAKRLFTRLAADPAYGFYRLAATARLKKMEAELNHGLLGKMKLFFKAPKSSGRNFLTANREGPIRSSEYSDESLVLEEFMQEKIAEDPESQESVVAIKKEEGKTEEEETPAATDEFRTDFGNREVTEKFEVAQALAQIGLVEWAKWDLYDIESKVRQPEHLKTLIDQYAKFGLFHRSSYIGQVRLGEVRMSRGLDSGRQLWEFAYPKAFKPSVYKYSLEFNVPVEYIWAIMRAETQYRKDAISPVGALGLMQVMPYTGVRLAKIKRESASFKPDNLLDPDNSIRYGTRYLQRLSEKTKGSLPLIASSYNAGPHRLNSWLRSFGALDTDEFIEHIPFLETRNYVKKVISNAQIYSLIYGNKLEVVPYLAGKLPVSIPEKPMYKEEWDD